MNLEESSEGSSCNGQENGDGFNGSERPLKKARFAWQVKGKYHLKNENNDPARISNNESTAPEIAGPSVGGSNASKSNNKGTKEDTKSIGGYLLNKNLDTLDSTVVEPNKSVLKPSTQDCNSKNPISNILTPSTTVAKEIHHTKKLSSKDIIESEILKPIIDSQLGSSQDSLSNYVLPSSHCCDALISMMTTENYTEDQCIARWQARQMEKVPVDNTINRVLDYIKENPSEEDLATLEAFDVADFINNLPGVNTIENEGILMAISAHGLQNASNSSISSYNSSSMSLDFEDISLSGIGSPALRISFSPIHSDDESQEESRHEFDYALDNAQSPYSYELKNEDNETQSPTFHGATSLTFQNLYENLHNTDAASNDVARIENDNHHDVLDAAVLFAIQSKGLTTFGTDYG